MIPSSFDVRAAWGLSRFAAAALDDTLEAPTGARELLAPLSFVDPSTPTRSRWPRPSVDRAALARGLEVANASYGHGRARELAAKFADPRTRVVVTGQQTGLLGGPLLTVVKALAADLWARRIERETGEPAVAVFWMATEDHDWNEVARVRLPSGTPSGTGPAGEAPVLDLGPDAAPLLPVGLRVLGGQLPAVLAAVEATLPSPWTRQRFLELAAPFRPEARFGEAFARLLVRLLGADRCPLLLDALLPEVKSAERAVMRRLVERRAEVDGALAAAEGRIRDAGFEPQVTPQPGVSPLFLLRGPERRRIVWAGAGPDSEQFLLRARGGGAETAESVETLLETIDENPGVVSPGVLARPLVQDAILGTTLQILGPGELAYMAQVASLYAPMGVEAPAVTLRPQALTLEAGVAGRLEESGFADELPVLLGRPSTSIAEAVSRRQRRGSGPAADSASARGPVATARAVVDAALATLGEEARAVDATLEKPFEKTRETIHRALESFETRLVAAEARRDETLLRRLERVREAALPGGEPQERVLTVAPAAARFGEHWIEDLAAGLENAHLDPRRVTVVVTRGAARE